MSGADISVIVAVAATMVGAVWAVMKIALHQFDRRLDERFGAMEAARVEAKKDWDRRFEKFTDEQRAIEREFSHFQATLPREYWRREDAIRNDTKVDAKLDAMNERLEHFITLQKMCPLRPAMAPAMGDGCVTVLREAQPRPT